MLKAYLSCCTYLPIFISAMVLLVTTPSHVTMVLEPTLCMTSCSHVTPPSNHSNDSIALTNMKDLHKSLSLPLTVILDR